MFKRVLVAAIAVLTLASCSFGDAASPLSGPECLPQGFQAPDASECCSGRCNPAARTTFPDDCICA